MGEHRNRELVDVVGDAVAAAREGARGRGRRVTGSSRRGSKRRARAPGEVRVADEHRLEVGGERGVDVDAVDLALEGDELRRIEHGGHVSCA